MVQLPMNKLTAKQELFCKEYTIDRNASAAAIRAGYYVYELTDPRDGSVFYVGKGKGERVYSHVREFKRKSKHQSNPIKVARIADIIKSGGEL